MGRQYSKSAASGRSPFGWGGIALLLAAGCGFRTGAPVTGLSLGIVSGATVEAGLREEIGTALTRALRDRGVGAGPAVDATLLVVRHDPWAAASAGVTAWRTEIALVLEVRSRPGCRATAAATSVWTMASAAGLDDTRTPAIRALAAEVVEQGLDRLLGEAACR